LKAEADAAYESGDHVRALQKLEQAWLAEQRPGLLANQGLVLERLGEPARAARIYERYLETHPAPALAALAREALHRVRPPQRFESTPSGATLYVDGAPAPVGKTPADVSLTVGAHTVRVELDGFTTARLDLIVQPGASEVRRLMLMPDSPTGPNPSERTPHRQGLSSPGIALVGVGVLGGIAGGVFYWRADVATADRDAATDAAVWDDADDRAHTLGWSAYGALAISSALTGLGVYLLVDAP
jgi:tetratricopeptide (TPR) repeat protein